MDGRYGSTAGSPARPAGAYSVRVKALPPHIGEPLEGSLSVSLEEQGSTGTSQSRNIFTKREFPFRCAP